MQIVKRDIQTTTRQIQQANVPANIKAILTSELTYAYQCHLYDLCNIYLFHSKHPNRKQFLDSVMQWQPLPNSQGLISGFYANMMVDNRSRHAAWPIGIKNDRQKFEVELAAYLKMPTIVSKAWLNHMEKPLLWAGYTRGFICLLVFAIKYCITA